MKQEGAGGGCAWAGPGDPRRAPPTEPQRLPDQNPKTVEGTGIMTWQFRKSKTSGPFRFTFGRRGVSTSVGFGPFRISLGADKRIRRTIRVPGTGIYETKVVDKNE